MTDVLIQLSRYIRDLLQIEENLIRQGRQNFDRGFFSSGVIVVDSIAGATPTANSRKYDGETETETFTTKFKESITIDFYGDSGLALENRNRFIVNFRSEKSRQLQMSLGIQVCNLSSTANLADLVERTYHDRYQIQLNCIYSISSSVELLRIDSAEITTIINK